MTHASTKAAAPEPIQLTIRVDEEVVARFNDLKAFMGTIRGAPVTRMYVLREAVMRGKC